MMGTRGIHRSDGRREGWAEGALHTRKWLPIKARLVLVDARHVEPEEDLLGLLLSLLQLHQRRKQVVEVVTPSVRGEVRRLANVRRALVLLRLCGITQEHLNTRVGRAVVHYSTPYSRVESCRREKMNKKLTWHQDVPFELGLKYPTMTSAVLTWNLWLFFASRQRFAKPSTNCGAHQDGLSSCMAAHLSMSSDSVFKYVSWMPSVGNSCFASSLAFCSTAVFASANSRQGLQDGCTRLERSDAM